MKYSKTIITTFSGHANGASVAELTKELVSTVRRELSSAEQTKTLENLLSEKVNVEFNESPDHLTLTLKVEI